MTSDNNALWKSQIYNKYIITFVFSLINAFFNFWFFRMALKDFGEDSFYYYAYSRRIIAFVGPILMMGVGVGLPRYMGVYFKYKRDISILLTSGLLIVSIISIAWGLINLILNNYITGILWGQTNHFTLSLNLSVCLFLISISIWNVIHSYYRGKLLVIASGIILLGIESVIPMLGFQLMKSLDQIYYLISILLIITAVTTIILILKKKRVLPRLAVIKKLLRYGVGRIPGDLALSLLVFLPSFFAVSFLSIEYAGIISFAGALLTLTTIPASAISFNILSRSAYLYINNKMLLRKEIEKILIGGAVYGIAAYLFLKFMLGSLIIWFMDISLLKHLAIMEYILLAIPPYLIFILLRSVIDGTETKAHNSKNLTISLLVFIVFGLAATINHSIYTIIFGIIAAYYTLGILSMIRVFKIFK